MVKSEKRLCISILKRKKDLKIYRNEYCKFLRRRGAKCLGFHNFLREGKDVEEGCKVAGKGRRKDGVCQTCKAERLKVWKQSTYKNSRSKQGKPAAKRRTGKAGTSPDLAGPDQGEWGDSKQDFDTDIGELSEEEGDDEGPEEEGDDDGPELEEAVPCSEGSGQAWQSRGRVASSEDVPPLKAEHKDGVSPSHQESQTNNAGSDVTDETEQSGGQDGSYEDVQPGDAEQEDVISAGHEESQTNNAGIASRDQEGQACDEQAFSINIEDSSGGEGEVGVSESALEASMGVSGMALCDQEDQDTGDQDFQPTIQEFSGGVGREDVPEHALGPVNRAVGKKKKRGREGLDEEDAPRYRQALPRLDPVHLTGSPLQPPAAPIVWPSRQQAEIESLRAELRISEAARETAEARAQSCAIAVTVLAILKQAASLEAAALRAELDSRPPPAPEAQLERTESAGVLGDPREAKSRACGAASGGDPASETEVRALREENMRLREAEQDWEFEKGHMELEKRQAGVRIARLEAKVKALESSL